MPTNAEILDEAMSRLGQRKSTNLRTSVVNEINIAIDELERGDFFPWFLQQTLSLSVSIGDTFVSLGTNFAREQEDARPYYVDGENNIHYLTKTFFAQLQGEEPSTELTYYALRGNELHFRLAASNASTLNVLAYVRQTGNFADNATEVSNLWLIEAKNWVFCKALKTVAALQVQNAPLASGLALMERQAKIDILNYHESREHTGHDYFVGGASDGS